MPRSQASQGLGRGSGRARFSNRLPRAAPGAGFWCNFCCSSFPGGFGAGWDNGWMLLACSDKAGPFIQMPRLLPVGISAEGVNMLSLGVHAQGTSCCALHTYMALNTSETCLAPWWHHGAGKALHARTWAECTVLPPYPAHWATGFELGWSAWILSLSTCGFPSCCRSKAVISAPRRELLFWELGWARPHGGGLLGGGLLSWKVPVCKEEGGEEISMAMKKTKGTPRELHFLSVHVRVLL